jgi:hypothetical protein
MPKPNVAVAGALLLTGMLVAGCSTPGPLHLYSLRQGGDVVHDLALDGHDLARDVPDYLESGDTLAGFAYDPYTDHFFLRLAPGNRVRVVDRPARKIKREITLEGVGEGTAGDMAICPRDGHIFLSDATRPVVIETTRFGKGVGRRQLEGQTTAPAAIAFDMANNRLVVLEQGGRTVALFDRTGAAVRTLGLDHAVRPCIAYDGESRELYAPLLDRADAVGVFDERGRLVRTVAIAAGDQFIDVGPHSFLRVF